MKETGAQDQLHIVWIQKRTATLSLMYPISFIEEDFISDQLYQLWPQDDPMEHEQLPSTIFITNNLCFFILISVRGWLYPHCTNPATTRGQCVRQRSMSEMIRLC